MNHQFRGFAINEQGTNRHCGLQLECLPVGIIERQGNGIVLDTSLSLFTQGSTGRNHINELTGHGNLALRFLGERHADGVADALGEQGANADGTLDAAVLALACLCDTEVKRIVHILLIHRLDKQTYGGNHHHSIRSLDGDDHIVELLTLKNTQELHAAFDDTLGGVTITRHDAVG